MRELASQDRVRLMHEYASQLCREVDAGEITGERLSSSLTAQWATVKAIELIGEQAWQLTKIGYDLGPAIMLEDVAGMRHRLVHDYEGVNWEIVKSVVLDDMPVLVKDLEAFMDKEGIDY